MIRTQIFALCLRVNVEEHDDDPFVEMQVDDASTAALAAAGQSHSNLAQPAGVSDDVSLLRVLQQLFLKLGIRCSVHQTGDELGEQRHLNKNHQTTVLQSNINASFHSGALSSQTLERAPMQRETSFVKNSAQTIP